MVKVRQRLLSRRGGSRGGGGSRRSQSSQPAPQAMMPPDSPSRRPIPYHAFQNFHFGFQSNLNRPIIFANISIIFMEEESSIQASANDMADSSQEGLRIAGRLSTEQQQGNIGQSSKQGGSKEAGKGMADSSSSDPLDMQPGGSHHGASATLEGGSNSSSSLQASKPPGGSGEGEEICGGDIWYGNECSVEEVPMDQDKLT